MSTLVTIQQGEDWVGDPPAQAPMAKVHKYDAASQQWAPVVPKSWDGYAWTAPSEYDYTWAYRSPFAPYLGAGTVWERDVSTMPLATKSADFANWMATHINYGPGFGPTGLNTSVNGTHPIQCYVVDSRVPGTNYQYITGSFGSGYRGLLLSGWVPWPKWAFVPQGGQDSALAIFDIGTGILREYYLVAKVAGHENRWTAVTGGYSIAPRDLADWPTYNYATQLAEGSSAVVRMHNHLGWIDIAGTRRGAIDHAIAYTCANMNVATSSGESIRLDGTRYTSIGASWPALSGDGDTVSDDAPIHGQWARLPLSLDLSPTGPYPPFLRMVIQAIQTYGMVATDSNNFVHAFNAEPGFAEKHWLGTDPWSADGDIRAQYVALNAAEGRDSSNPFDMAAFPWALTEWAPRNWGKPE